MREKIRSKSTDKAAGKLTVSVSRSSLKKRNEEGLSSIPELTQTENAEKKNEVEKCTKTHFKAATSLFMQDISM